MDADSPSRAYSLSVVLKFYKLFLFSIKSLFSRRVKHRRIIVYVWYINPSGLIQEFQQSKK